MGIIYRTGNVVDALLNGEVDFIMHCANCRNKFGSGVAYEIRMKIPEAFEADTYMHRQLSPEQILGIHSHASGVVNLYGQLNYGYGKRQVNYGALASAIVHSMGHWATGIETIGIPYKMASDRAGGDWNIVLELIEHLIVPYVKEVVVYRLGE